jgi:hypothetical protein
MHFICTAYYINRCYRRLPLDPYQLTMDTKFLAKKIMKFKNDPKVTKKDETFEEAQYATLANYVGVRGIAHIEYTSTYFNQTHTNLITNAGAFLSLLRSFYETYAEYERYFS